MRLGDWTATRVISVAAHGVDIALTLRRVPWTTRSALTVMGGVFVSLLGVELPQRLAWDDQLLLEAATGRRALTTTTGWSWDRCRNGSRSCPRQVAVTP
jgi:hypothetical protein